MHVASSVSKVSDVVLRVVLSILENEWTKVPHAYMQ